MAAARKDESGAVRWAAANRAYLQAELERLRLLIDRRVLWLRKAWRQDPMPTYQGFMVTEAQADALLLGEDRHAEARFFDEDAELADVSRQIADRAQDIERQASSMAGRGVLPALHVLARLFGLGTFEQSLVLLCLAPEIDSGFERLYAYVQDEVSRKQPTHHLALALFGGTGEALDAACNSLLPDAPLVRYRLVTVEPGTPPGLPRAACPLRLDDDIADFVRGTSRSDPRVADLLWPVPPAPLAPSHRALTDRVVQYLTRAGEAGPPPILNLTGEAGVGRRCIARAVAEGVGQQLVRLETGPLAGPADERGALLRLLEREALLSQRVYYVDAGEPGPADIARTDALHTAVNRLGGLLVLASPQRWKTDRATLTVSVSRPDREAQRALWHEVLSEARGPSEAGRRGPQTPAVAPVGQSDPVEAQLDAVVQQFDFGPHAIAEAMDAAIARARLRSAEGEATVQPGDLWDACRQQAREGLDQLAQRITPCYGWDDIVLPPDVLQQLREIATQVAHRPQVYERWGFGEKLSRGRGISVLFAGPSGTGKTMAAEILAGDLALDLYRIDLAGVVNKYIGETEKNLKKVFDAAERSGAILFFDEADALFGKRTEVKDSHDRYANIEVNYLLQRMEDYRGLAILASNRKSSLDRAFLRRLRFLVDLPFPDAESRRRIWQKVFPAQARVATLDYRMLARLELSGGNVRNIALNAAFLAAGEDAPIGMTHVMHAARREYAKIDKLASERDFGPYYHRGRQ